MTLLLLTTIAAVIAVAFAAHFTLITHDRPRRPPQSHGVDPDFLPPSRLV